MLADLVFRHPDLDFATTHIYEPGAIDAPVNTLAAADAMARWVRHALSETRDGRPFTDSETGPIHTFKDLGITLPEAFDIAYFRNMAWAHLASGGAGGGMRWPNRLPHTLTPGMRVAQGVMSDFARLIDWSRFAAINISEEIRTEPENLLAYGCADPRQAVIWAVRDRDELDREGDLPFRPLLAGARIELPPMEPGRHRVTYTDTHNGHILGEEVRTLDLAPAVLTLPPFRHDLAIAIRREDDAGPEDMRRPIRSIAMAPSAGRDARPTPGLSANSGRASLPAGSTDASQARPITGSSITPPLGAMAFTFSGETAKIAARRSRYRRSERCNQDGAAARFPFEPRAGSLLLPRWARLASRTPHSPGDLVHGNARHDPRLLRPRNRLAPDVDRGGRRGRRHDVRPQFPPVRPDVRPACVPLPGEGLPGASPRTPTRDHRRSTAVADPPRVADAEGLTGSSCRKSRQSVHSSRRRAREDPRPRAGATRRMRRSVMCGQE